MRKLFLYNKKIKSSFLLLELDIRHKLRTFSKKSLKAQNHDFVPAIYHHYKKPS